MGSVRSSVLGTLVERHARVLAVSLFLGFGFAACTGGDGGEGGDEPVQVEEGQTASEDIAAADMPLPEDATTAPAETPAPGTDDPGLAGDGVGFADQPVETAPEALVTDAAAPAEAATPEPGENTATETVDAELSSAAPTGTATEAPAPDPLEASLDSAPAVAPEAPAAPAAPEAPSSMAASSGSAAYGEVSSPGAAKFIKSKNEGAAASAPSTASTPSTGAASDHYIVQSGDTLARIAARIYGTAKAYQQLAQQNGLSAPYVIRPGDELKYDGSSPQAQAFAAKYSKAKRTVTVKKGDTLTRIATRLYGTPYAWKILLSHNKDKITNPNDIKIGMTLAYVGSAPGAKGVKAAKAKAAPAAAAPAAEAPADAPAE